MASARMLEVKWFRRIRDGAARRTFARDLSLALAVKFLLLAALYYAFVAPLEHRGEPLGSAAVAQVLLGHSASIGKTRHDR